MFSLVRDVKQVIGEIALSSIVHPEIFRNIKLANLAIDTVDEIFVFATLRLTSFEHDVQILASDASEIEESERSRSDRFVTVERPINASAVIRSPVRGNSVILKKNKKKKQTMSYILALQCFEYFSVG